MRILVTGGAGFIGSHIVDRYLAAGHDVAVVDNLAPYGGGKRTHIPAGVRFYPTDIRDAAALGLVFERERPDIVNHQAAQPSVKVSTDDPLLDADVNITGLLHVLEASRRVGVRKVIFASSGAIYGTPARIPMDEETALVPESPYGITKMVGEHYLRYYQSACGLEFTACRYGNVYGPRQDPNGEAGVIAIFTQRLLAGQPVRIDWDGEQAKDYVYVTDVAQASVHALERGANRVYCLGTGIATSVNELHRRLVDIIGRETAVTRAPKRPGDVRLALFDNRRAHEELGWTPAVTLDDGLRSTVDFFRQQLSPMDRDSGASPPQLAPDGG